MFEALLKGLNGFFYITLDREIGGGRWEEGDDEVKGAYLRIWTVAI